VPVSSVSSAHGRRSPGAAGVGVYLAIIEEAKLWCVQTLAKITPADYPDLLAAVDARTPQREIARRYDCAPSLVARHIAKAERTRTSSEPARGRDPGVTDPLAPIDPRAEFERIVRTSGDARSRIAALKELAALDQAGKSREKQPDLPPGIRWTRSDQIRWRNITWQDEPDAFAVLLRQDGRALFISKNEADPDRDPEYTPMSQAAIEELNQRIAAKRAARRSRLARRIWELRRQAAAAQAR
jgi:hypothetical protein